MTILVELERSNHLRRVWAGLALLAPPLGLAARGRQTFIIQVNLIKARDGSLERY